MNYHLSLAILAMITCVLELAVTARFCTRSWRDDLTCLTALIVLTLVFGLWVGTFGAVMASLVGAAAGLYLAMVTWMARQIWPNWQLRTWFRKHAAVAPAALYLD